MRKASPIHVVQSTELRAELAAWTAKFEELRSDESSVQQFTQGVLFDYWFASAPLRDVFRLDQVGPSKFSIDAQTILRDRRFESILHERLTGEFAVLDDYDKIEVATEYVLGLTAESLSN